MARIDGVSDAQAGLSARFLFTGAKRIAGQVPDPLRIMAHSKPIMWADGLFEVALARAHSVPPRLKALAGIKAAALIGCVF